MSSYQTYKADTTTFTTWLTQTAISCGYAPVNIESVKRSQLSTSDKAPTPTSSTGGPEPVVLVGNRKERRDAAKRNEAARKAAVKEATRKQAKIAPATASSPDPQPKHFIVKTQELIHQANAIAAAKFTVPDTVIKVVEQGIAARKRCSAWFQERGDHNGQSTEGHLYFIGVLEKTLQILAPARVTIDKVSNTALATHFKASGGLEDRSNRFSALEIEDIEDISNEEPFSKESTITTDVPASTSTPKPPSKSTDIYELEHNRSVERLFIVFCFFEDLMHTRKFLRKIWEGYRNGDTQLTTASFITNSALELVHKAEDDIMVNLYPEDTEERRKASRESFFELSKLLRNLTDFSGTWKDFVYWDAATRISDLFSALKGKKHAWRPPIDEVEHSLWGLWLEGIWECKDDTGRHLTQNVGFRDLYSQGRKQTCLKGGLTSWMAFGATVLLDIYALGLDNASITQNMGDELKTSFIRLQTKLAGPGSKTPFVMKMESTLFGLNALMLAPITPEKNDPTKIAADIPHVARTLYNPIFCGIKILELSVDREVAGIALANYHVSIFTMAHLYNAIRICSPEMACWVELEHVMTIHNRALFGGGLPTNFKDCVSRIMLKYGLSLNSAVSQIRRGRIGAHGIENQRIRKHEQNRPGFKYGPLLPYNRNAAILKEYFAGEKRFEQILFQVQKATQEDSSESRKQGQLFLAAKQPGFVQQLIHLHNWVPQVIEYLNTDYLTLTRVINEFLRILVVSLNESFPGHQPPFSSRKQVNSLEPGHLEMVFSLLMEAERIEKMQEKKKSSELFQSTGLVKAGQVLHQFILDLKVRKEKSEDGEILEKFGNLCDSPNA